MAMATWQPPMSEFDTRAVFLEELDRAAREQESKSGFQRGDWFWSGPRDGQASLEWWQEQGPEFVQNFIDWYEFNPEAETWITPDGIPAIELPIQVMFGETPVRMVLDWVIQLGTALVVVDWKSSAKAPLSPRQLGIYACGIELKYGIRPRYGTFFMVRGVGPRQGPKTHFLQPVDLGAPQYSVAYLTSEFAQAEQGIQAGAFPASPGENCGRCGVAWACTEVNGESARQLDPNYPGGKRA